MQKPIALVGFTSLINIVLAQSAFAGPPVPSVEVVNQDPIPVVGTVEVVPPAQGGSTEVAVTEVPSEVIDLLSEISEKLEKLDDLRPVSGTSYHVRAPVALGFLERIIVDPPDVVDVSSITVSALPDKDFELEVVRGGATKVWGVNWKGLPQDARGHFTFPVPIDSVSAVWLTCLDFQGCGFPWLSVVGRSDDLL